MKKMAGLFLLVLLMAGCSSDQKPFEVFNPEVFTFDLGEGWEVNATARVRNFEQKEENKEFAHHVTFSLDLLPQQGEKISGIASGVYKKSLSEKAADLQLDAQFELDSTFTAASYKIIWNIKDELTGKSLNKEISFTLSAE